MAQEMTAEARTHLKELIGQMIQADTEAMTFNRALSLDVDAFLWIAAELERIWKDLVVCADDPNFCAIHRIAADLFCVIDEAKAFAQDTREDLKTLEEEAVESEQNTVDS